MTLAELLVAIDDLPLECDGLTRALSTLLQRDAVAHRVHVGRVQVEKVGTIHYHWWIALPDGRLCDLRARMWLGLDKRVPHGVFEPKANQLYQPATTVQPASIRLAPSLFYMLTAKPLDAFAPLSDIPPSKSTAMRAHRSPPNNETHEVQRHVQRKDRRNARKDHTTGRDI